VVTQIYIRKPFMHMGDQNMIWGIFFMMGIVSSAYSDHEAGK